MFFSFSTLLERPHYPLSIVPASKRAANNQTSSFTVVPFHLRKLLLLSFNFTNLQEALCQYPPLPLDLSLSDTEPKAFFSHVFQGQEQALQVVVAALVERTNNPLTDTMSSPRKVRTSNEIDPYAAAHVYYGPDSHHISKNHFRTRTYSTVSYLPQSSINISYLQ